MRFVHRTRVRTRSAFVGSDFVWLRTRYVRALRSFTIQVIVISPFSERQTLFQFLISNTYRIAHVYLVDMLNDEADDPKTVSPEQAYVAINKHVHNDMAKATAFAVELSGTVLASNSIGGPSRPTSSASAGLKSARVEPISADERNHHRPPRRNSKSADLNPLRNLGQAPKVFPAAQSSLPSSSVKGGILQHKGKDGEVNGHHEAIAVNASSIYPTAALGSLNSIKPPPPPVSSSSNNNTRRRIPKLVSPRQKEDLLFVEVHEVLLDKYVQLQSGNVRKLKRKNSLSARRFKAICLPEQELVCLFPDSVDTRICKIISTGIVNAKRKVYRDRRDSRRSSNQSESAGTTGVVEVPPSPTFQLAAMPNRHLANKLTPPMTQH